MTQIPTVPDRRPSSPPGEVSLPEARRPGPQAPGEIGGPKGPEPTRYGDWEVGGRCSDF